MASHQTRPLTLLERLGYVGAVLRAVVNTLRTIPSTYHAVRGAGWSTKRILAVSFLRNGRGPVREPIHLLRSPTTGQIINTTCRKLKVSVESTVIPCGDFADATLHEIQLLIAGSRSTKDRNVLIYFHGGGYRNPIAGDGHIPVVLDAARAADCESVVFLEYTLTPACRYPGQLVQAATAVNAVMKKEGIGAEQILLGGDSAGGNLALGVLAHVIKPHPDVPVIASGEGRGEERFKGVFLLSPWVSNSFTARSFAENENKDYISASLMNMFTDFWAPRDEIYAEPLCNDANTFWESLPANKVLITVGGFEAFRDDVVAMANLMKKARGTEVELLVAVGETHVQPVVDRAIGEKDGRSMSKLLEWCQGM